MSERELRAQLHHLLLELELVMGVLQASQQTREIGAAIRLLKGRRARFTRSGFVVSPFDGMRQSPPNPPEAEFPLKCTPKNALRRLARGCEASSDFQETPGRGIRPSDLLSFAESLRERTEGLTNRPPVTMSQVAARCAWQSAPDKPVFLVHDGGFWNHQTRGIGKGTLCAVLRGDSGLRSERLVPGGAFRPALRLILNDLHPDSHQAFHVIIDGPRQLEILASPPLGRGGDRMVDTTRIVQAQLDARRLSVDNVSAFFRSF